MCTAEEIRALMEEAMKGPADSTLAVAMIE